jgi:hypothetical protein
LVSINGIYAFKAVVDEEIPAVAFPEAPLCPCSAAVCVTDTGCSCGTDVVCTGVGAATSGSFGESMEGIDEENVVPDENWIPP